MSQTNSQLDAETREIMEMIAADEAGEASTPTAEIDQAPAPVPVPTAVNQPEPVDQSVQLPVADGPGALADDYNYPAGLPEHLRAQYRELDRMYIGDAQLLIGYTQVMGGERTLAPASGARQQARAMGAFGRMLNAPWVEFTKNVAWLFPFIVHHQDGVFSAQKRVRFLAYLESSPRDSAALPYLFNLLCMIADPRTRVGVVMSEANRTHLEKNLSLASSENGLNQQGRENLMRILQG